MKVVRLSQAINKGIDYLLSVQEKDGSFLSFSSSDEHDFTQSISYNTTFLNSFILLMLSSLSPQKTNLHIMKKLAAFLLDQKSNHWSWNYWKRNSVESKKTPYPDDLDCTFCSLAALFHYDKKLITGQVLAHLVKVLTATEKKEGGPYSTWLVKKNSLSHWKDVDFAVNSNVAYGLTLVDIQLPNLTEFFEKKLKRNDVLSPYYPSFSAPLFFLSRFYRGTQKKVIENILITAKNKNGKWENPLKTALGVLSLLNLGYPYEKLEESISYLQQTQNNGKWEAYGFSIDPTINGKKHFAGSPALTTAFCLAAIQKYLSVKAERKTVIQTEKKEKEKSNLKKSIIEEIAYDFSKQKYLFDNKGELLLQKIYSGDTTEQIPLMPYYFFQALGPKKKKITRNNIIELGRANILGWIAYTIYDDFLDEEGDPILLSLANFSLRNLTHIFETFPSKKEIIQKNFHEIMDRIDLANTWETKYCRTPKNLKKESAGRRIKIPNYGNLDQLANKSIGHALGPLTILLLLGYTRTSKEFKNIFSFFTHYLIAKQLNDDAHDFHHDLEKGRITPVVALLLKKAKQKKIVMTQKNLQKIFWNEVIVEVCQLIYSHVKKAKRALKKSHSISYPNILESLLIIFEKGADQALTERERVMAFLKTYEV